MQIVRYASLAIWLGLVAMGSLLPRIPSPADVTGFAGAALRACGRGRWPQVLAAARGALLLGFGLECLQPLTGRTFDLLDLAANSAGAALGFAAVTLARAVRRGA